jgi:hypothetical protein
MLKDSTDELQGRANSKPDKPRPSCMSPNEHPGPNGAGEIADEDETVGHHRIESFRELNWSGRNWNRKKHDISRALNIT